MTVNELYQEALSLNIADEDVNDVVSLIRTMSIQTKPTAYCAHCKLRKTDQCPYPQSSGLGLPVCLDFKA